ncbi:MAG: hypothetical protein ACXVZV_06515 [Terriglobales bacterium]
MLIVLFAVPVVCQVKVGDNTNLALSGNLGLGYSGGFDDYSGSNHGTFVSGQADLSGSYYNPMFLSFHVQPFYNRNQDSSSFSSILNETGVNLSTSLFSGSHFPGSISYGKNLTTGSQYGLPGTPGLSTDGSNRNFEISWSALFPNLPSLTATFADSSSSESLLGETGTIDTAIRTFTLMSTYKLDGFGLFGNFIHQNFNTTLPAFLAGDNAHSDSSNTSYSIGATHALPFSGTFGVSYLHSGYNNESGAASNNGTADTVTGSVGFSPTQRFAISGQVNYYHNVLGVLQGSALPSGSLPLEPFNSSSNAISLNTFATYNLGHRFILTGYANHQIQHYADQEYSNSQYGATLTYSYARPLLGMLYFSFGMVNTAGNGNQGTMAAVGNLGLKKQIRGWDINADVSYSQNLQNSISLFTTSNYSYGGSVRRRFGANTYWTAAARNVQTGMTQFTGYNTRSETFMTSLVRRKIGISGSYSQSHGTSVLTTSGELVPTPLAPVITTGEVVYDGTAYGGSLNLAPLRRMVITGSWFHMTSDTTSNLTTGAPLLSMNNSNRIYAQLQYNLRKLTVRAIYWRENQLISASGLPNATRNSYSFTISRWFNIF